MTFKETLLTMAGSMITGLVLALFSVLQAPFNALTSLIGVAVVIMYFRKFDRKGHRITFVIFSILYYLMSVFMIAVYQYIPTQT
ncbi:hypothetical protein NKT34_06110 [Paenibacillus polysaccharolyticus]|jgi:hypothetical protein|uniref:Uncharacterized protein n=3 Tax=Paenibacillus TaxID=44249 RepID=A0A5M9WLJ9_PAEAM|nr:MULTISPECIES: hypothetical protein [Paenibacillus]MDP9699579.1 hypothetical protein [Paenibacillus intestini]KAA8782418.1 hypothetical protein EC604_00965 [Paenibacillus amylolyticus]MBY0204514.1 hypothetical protein [Paenibacillus cucumis (ex Kampfer et al. 2016)]MCM3133665.1 hypothetical protein [Paenibacillus polysaccharolyticus]MCP1132854.1 hypothetical protein [Paenibacillus polysaccharolyticus]